jgi:hypothetical protein
MRTNDLERCLREGRLVRTEPNDAIVAEEMDAADFDLDTAMLMMSFENAKWASVIAYYSMFHSAKALVLSRGYLEKGHRCLLVALRELLVERGEMDEDMADDFGIAMEARLDADYALDYSMVTAGRVVDKAGSMLDAARSILGR